MKFILIIAFLTGLYGGGTQGVTKQSGPRRPRPSGRGKRAHVEGGPVREHWTGK